MKLLHIIPSLDPVGGGPMEGVRLLATECKARGIHVEIACLDEPSAAHLSNFPAAVHALGPSLGSYKYSRKLVPWLRENVGHYDAVIVNGLWQYHGFGAWRALRESRVPYIVFAHGMLDPWFKRRYPLKHLKKWAYWPWGEYRVLRDASAVVFTCEEERRVARESFWLYKAREFVSSYGSSDIPLDAEDAEMAFFEKYPELQGKRLLLFLGRIHQKKGCDLLVKAFARIAEAEPDLRLIMAGPDQVGWGDDLRRLASAHGVADRVHWTGMLSGALKWGALSAAEAFCLPSHQENFGIAVAEALACGTPVLISNKVNIFREIQMDAAGIVGDDTLAGTTECLRSWIDLGAVQRREMAIAARRCFESRFRIQNVADDVLEIIRRARLGAGDRGQN